MSSLILCHKQKATQPYKLPHIRYKIYTIEEMAYVIFDNLYLLDHTLMSESLCEWLEGELGLFSLADSLREQIAKRVSLEDFILYFLEPPIPIDVVSSNFKFLLISSSINIFISKL